MKIDMKNIKDSLYSSFEYFLNLKQGKEIKRMVLISLILILGLIKKVKKRVHDKLKQRTANFSDTFLLSKNWFFI